jgi:hypothetical protein
VSGNGSRSRLPGLDGRWDGYFYGKLAASFLIGVCSDRAEYFESAALQQIGCNAGTGGVI